MSSINSTGEAVVADATQATYSAQNGFIFLGIAAAITILRTYARWSLVGFRGLKPDDYIVWLALVLYLGETYTNYFITTQLYGLDNADIETQERAALDRNSEEYRMRVTGSQLHFVAWPQYAVLLWSLKAAMVFLYVRLMDGLAVYRKKIQGGFILVGVTFAIVTLVPFLSCIPTDTYLIWIPMPMLFKSMLPRSTKVALMILFGCGVFVTVAATLRITSIATKSYDMRTVGFWAISETFVAITTTNLPCILVLLRRLFSPFFSFLRSGTTVSGRGPTRPRGAVMAGQKLGQCGGGGGDGDSTLMGHSLYHLQSGMESDSEAFAMTKMGTYSVVEGNNSSRERIVHEDKLNDSNRSRRSSSEDGQDGAAKKMHMVCKASLRSKHGRGKTGGGFGEFEGIKKQVEITIVKEDRSHAHNLPSNPSKEARSPNNHIDVEPGMRSANLPSPPGKARQKH